MVMQQLTNRLIGSRKAWAVLALFCASATGVLVAYPETAEAPLKLMQQTQDALDEFLGRSPGERDNASIMKGKVKGKSGTFADAEVAAGAPEQQALGKVFEAPSEEPESLPGTEPVETVAADPVAPVAAQPSVLAPLAFTPFSGGGGGLIGGGGGGGGGGGPNPPVGPVPEPSTWAMFILGFMFIGHALRRRRSVLTGLVRA